MWAASLILALLIPSPQILQGRPRIVAGGAANDCSSSFILYQQFESHASEVWTNSGSDSNCDLTGDGNTAPNVDTDAGDFMVGSASAETVKTGTDSHWDIDKTNCDYDDGGDIAHFGWVEQLTGTTVNAQLNNLFDQSNNGTSIHWRGNGGCNGPTDDCFRFYVEGVANAESTVKPNPVTQEWHFILGSYDDTSGEATLYYGSETSWSGDVTSDVGDSPSIPRGNPGTTGFPGWAQSSRTMGDPGHFDDGGIYNGELTAAWAKRIWACDVDGALCTCSGSTYTDDGRASSSTGMPDCNATCP